MGAATSMNIVSVETTHDDAAVRPKRPRLSVSVSTRPFAGR